MDTLIYFMRLVRSLGWSVPRPDRRHVLAAFVLACVPALAAMEAVGEQASKGPAGVTALQARAARLTTLMEQTERAYAEHVAPIERVLLQYRDDDTTLVRNVAVSLVREARRADLEPRLLLAVMLVENPWIDPAARSSVGARGLMQVMPLHQGNWKACAPDLDSVGSNICHGAQIFASYLRATDGDVDRALLRYNGCVRGTNTPGCHQYPNHVYARAGRASVLAWSAPGMAAAR